MANLDVIILAGGKGSRMRSEAPKPLHAVGGKPTVQRIIESTKGICEQPIIVVGHGGENIMRTLGGDLRYVVQEEQRGTGHAIRCALTILEQEHFEFQPDIMVLPGDHPLVSPETLHALYAAHHDAGAVVSLCTLRVPDFSGRNQLFYGYGRIKRDASGKISGIVELKDANEEEKAIPEVNVGYYCFETTWLQKNIAALTDKNAAGEFYITDLIGIAVSQGVSVQSYTIQDPVEAMGFNTPEQFHSISKLFQR